MKPLTQQEMETLGRFNTEQARGLLHSEEWLAKMKELQARFDHHYNREAVNLGALTI